MTNLRTFLPGAALIAVLSTNTGCGDNLEAVPDAGPPDAIPTSFTECDSDTSSWVRNSYLAVVGHRPHSQAEVDVYVALHDQIAALVADGETTLDPKAVVVKAMTEEPAYLERWTSHFMDALRVTRTDDQAMGRCYDDHGSAGGSSELAAFVRDNPPTASREPFSMLDLVKSSVALDDPTPLYRGHLFALLSFPIPAANVEPVEAELARREDFGAVFDSAYLNRDMVCLTCHNSESSVTDGATPELDRHWPIAGLFEQSLYGASNGLEPARAHAVFRFDGFVSFGEEGAKARKPWGWKPECGSFSNDPGPDPAEIDGKFGNLTGTSLTVYDLEASLHAGFDGLRGGALAPGTGGAIADPDQALAYLTAATIVEGVWKEVVGSGLTIANYFPRNQASSDLLESLTDRFLDSGYSLSDLLVAIVSSDYFSRQLPEEGCGDQPYIYPNVFDPWVISDDDEARRRNGPGDAIAAISARTLMRGTYVAMQWPVPVDFDFPGGGGGTVGGGDGGGDGGGGGGREPPPRRSCDGLTCTELVVSCYFDSACCTPYFDQCPGGTSETCDSQTCSELETSCNDGGNCCDPYAYYCSGPGGGPACEVMSCEDLEVACQQNECCEIYDAFCTAPPGGGDGSFDETSFQQGVGAFLKNGERGFRGLDFQARLVWENRFGACANQSESEDFVDELVAAAAADNAATVQDVVIALKDRLIGEPRVDESGEGEALAVVMGGGLDRVAGTVTDLEARTRTLCGVLLASPQFVLSGAAGRGGEVPRLTPPAWQYGAVCADVGPRVADVAGSGLAVACEDGDLTVTVPAAP